MYERTRRVGLSAMVNVYAADASGTVLRQQWVDDPNVTALEEGGAGCADAAGAWHYPCGGGGGAPAAAPAGSGPSGEPGTVQCVDDSDGCHRQVERIGHCEGQLVRVLSAVGPGCGDEPEGGGEGGGVLVGQSGQLVAGVPNLYVYVGLGLLVYLLVK